MTAALLCIGVLLLVLGGLMTEVAWHAYFDADRFYRKTDIVFGAVFAVLCFASSGVVLAHAWSLVP